MGSTGREHTNREYEQELRRLRRAVLSGLFYAASHHEIGSFSVTMCQYGGSFCSNPILVLTGAGLAALWGGFVSVR